MFFVIVGVIVILMNLAGIGSVGDWNWKLTGDLWKFCVPFGLAILWWIWTDKSGLDKRREIAKMDAKKQARRTESMRVLGMDAKGRRKGRKR